MEVINLANERIQDLGKDPQQELRRELEAEIEAGNLPWRLGRIENSLGIEAIIPIKAEEGKERLTLKEELELEFTV